MGIENLEVSGFYSPGAFINRTCNPTHTSLCVNLGDNKNVLICREPGCSFGDSGVSADEEIKRRKLAVELSSQILPKYTLENRQVILQGYDNGKQVPVLARLTEKIDNLKLVSDFSLRDLIGDSLVSKALFDVSRQHFKSLVTKGICWDVGYYGTTGSSLPRLISVFTQKLTDINMMVGFDKNGRRKCFIDPDWYFKPKEFKLNPVSAYSKRIFLLSSRILFFGSLTLFQRVKEKIDFKLNKPVLQKTN